MSGCIRMSREEPELFCCNGIAEPYSGPRPPEYGISIGTCWRHELLVATC